ncbi:hypothetical protein [Larkinella arboricola]
MVVPTHGNLEVKAPIPDSILFKADKLDFSIVSIESIHYTRCTFPATSKSTK